MHTAQKSSRNETVSEFFSPSSADVLLVTLSFLSSAVTAILGLGGGIMLLSVMPGLMPTDAILPVHGVVQFASNGSRALFSETSIQWPSTISFSIGAIIGAVVGSQFVMVMPPEKLFLYLGIFILVVTWTPFARVMRHLPVTVWNSYTSNLLNSPAKGDMEKFGGFGLQTVLNCSKRGFVAHR